MEARLPRVSVTGGRTPEQQRLIVCDERRGPRVDPGRDAGRGCFPPGDGDHPSPSSHHGNAATSRRAPAVEASTEEPVGCSRDRLLWREAHPDGDPENRMEDGGSSRSRRLAGEVIHAPGQARARCALQEETRRCSLGMA